MSTFPRNGSTQPSNLHLSISLSGPNEEHGLSPRSAVPPIPHAYSSSIPLFQSTSAPLHIPPAVTLPFSEGSMLFSFSIAPHPIANHRADNSDETCDSLSGPRPVCLRCRFDEIVPYIPNVDVEAVLRSGPSPYIQAIAPAIVRDLPPLRKYLSILDQLFKEIADSRDRIPYFCPARLCPRCRIDDAVPCIDADTVLRSDTSSFIKTLPPTIAQDIPPFRTHLDHLFNDISERCNQVRKEVEYHEAALAPIQALPVDLLLEIFMLVPMNVLKPLSSPWIFGRVCASWRFLCLSTPSLWSRIIIDDFHGLSGPNVEAALEIYLSRSITHPLTICLDSLPFPDPTRDSDPITHLSTIAAHASRWTAVQLEMTSSQLTKLLEMIQEPPSCVRILEISVIKDTEDGHSSIPYKPVFSLSPVVHGAIYGVSTSTFPLFLNNLTTFCCDLNEPSDLPRLLEHATELETLRIVPEPIAGPSDLLKSNGPTVYHPTLRRFTIFVYWTQKFISPAVPLSIDSICLSGLRELELVTHDMPGIAFMPLFDSEDMARIYNLIRQSGCALNILRIYSPLPWSDLLPTLVAQGQSLTTLHLFINTVIASPVFCAFSMAERGVSGRSALTETILLPNLQHLTFSEEPCTGTDIGMMGFIDVLYDAILSRWDCLDVKRLNSLRLILVDKPLTALRRNPATAFGLLHLIGLKRFGLDVTFLVDGDDVLEADRWLVLLGEE